MLNKLSHPLKAHCQKKKKTYHRYVPSTFMIDPGKKKMRWDGLAQNIILILKRIKTFSILRTLNNY